ncbi:MAG: hypothetical protein JRN50_02250 [Nitrososphaerota archaeon]|nr:hypothetical protein [Nitrososphaerota archaeon]
MGGTPTSDEIREEAEAEWMSEHSDREGYSNTNRPEISELKEGGHWDRAKARLMHEHGDEYQRRAERRKEERVKPQSGALESEAKPEHHPGAGLKRFGRKVENKVNAKMDSYKKARKEAKEEKDEEKRQYKTAFKYGRREGIREAGRKAGRQAAGGYGSNGLHGILGGMASHIKMRSDDDLMRDLSFGGEGRMDIGIDTRDLEKSLGSFSMGFGSRQEGKDFDLGFGSPKGRKRVRPEDLGL